MKSMREIKISPEGLVKRKRFFVATLVTCAAAAIIGGSLHVVELGSNRMADMRDKAGYDLKDEAAHIRAAGEDIVLHRMHKGREIGNVSLSVMEVEAMLPEATWTDLASFIDIPAGEFKMGTDRRQTDVQNTPEHVVTTAAYKISRYPVTNAQYAKFVAETGHRAPQHWDGGKTLPSQLLHPVTMVSWFDGRDYCQHQGGDVPTEAQWEKAARGVDGRRWPWGDMMTTENLNTYYNVGSTTDVTRFKDGASVYGVMDMAGNVSEWTRDEFLPYSGSDAPNEIFEAKMGVATTPLDRALKVVELVAVEAKYRVMRGGSWKSDPFSTATYHRNYSFPQYASDFYGFRCVVETSTQTSQKK